MDFMKFKNLLFQVEEEERKIKMHMIRWGKKNEFPTLLNVHHFSSHYWRYMKELFRFLSITFQFSCVSILCNKHYNSRTGWPLQDWPADPPLCAGWWQRRPGVQLLPGQPQPVQRQVVQGAAWVLQIHASRVTACQGLSCQRNENQCKSELSFFIILVFDSSVEDNKLCTNIECLEGKLKHTAADQISDICIYWLHKL